MRTKAEINSSTWFGELPEKWSMVPLSALFLFSKGLSITKADLVETGKPVISYGQIHSKQNVGVETREILLRRIPNDLVGDTSPSRVLSDGFVFADTSEDLEGCGNNVRNDTACELYGGYHTIVLNPRWDFNSKYLAYLFATDAWRFQIRRDLVDVKLFSVSQTSLNETYAIVPPYDVQRRIVSYLDERCAAIDEDVAKRRDVIGKLKEYKKSLIAHAVTKGLDPNTEMKDSGVDWIGEVPANWRLTKIGQVYDLRNTKVSDCDYEPLSVTMQGIVPQLDSAAKTDAHDDRKLVMEGDFVINSRSDRRGSCGIARQDGSVSPINTVLIPREHMEPRFYDWLFHTTLFADEFYKNGHGIVDDLWTTKWAEMKGITIVEPPFETQITVANYLDECCASVDEAISRQEQLIEKLGEYRKSVIHHAVTGKIDCTEA